MTINEADPQALYPFMHGKPQAPEKLDAVTAFAKAKEMGLSAIGLTGGAGGKMRTSGVVDHCLVIPTTSIHRIQERHVLPYHILWDLAHTLLADDRSAATTKGEAA